MLDVHFLIRHNHVSRPGDGVVERMKRLPRSGRVRSLFRGTCSVLEATHGDGFEAPSVCTRVHGLGARRVARFKESPALGDRPILSCFVRVPGTCAVPCSHWDGVSSLIARFKESPALGDRRPLGTQLPIAFIFRIILSKNHFCYFRVV